MKKSFFITVVFSVVILICFFGCTDKDKEDAGRKKVNITFYINFEGGVSPQPVTIFEGTAAERNWPANPVRPGYFFDGWFDESDIQYTRDTIINGNIAVTARWSPVTAAKPNPPAEDITGFFDTANGFPARLSDSRKIWGMNNPLITFAYLADPVPMVFCHANPPCINNSGQTSKSHCDQCRLYLFGSNDTLAFNNNGVPLSEGFGIVIQGLRLISSADLVNWTDHGPLNLTAKNSTHPLFPTPVEKIVPYANDTWAPSAEWKIVNGKPKFFLYWCNSGTDTSVVVSDYGPIGPWYNPGLSKSMINRDMQNADSEWLFDPGTMIDDNGAAYIVLGGGGSGADPGNARRAQLSADMYSISGNVEKFNAPYMFEASDIWKWNGIYYLNYTANWGTGGNPYGLSNIDIVYTMNRAGPMLEFPTGNADFGRPAKLLPNGGYGDSTNHASLFDYKDQPYIVYHASSACQAYGVTRLRVAHLDKLTVNADGTLQQLSMGVKGIEQVGDFNPYNINEAETMAIGGGIYTKYDEKAGNSICVASIDTGDWLGLYGVNFDLKDGGASKFNAYVKIPVSEDAYAGAIEIRLDPNQQGIALPANGSRLGTGSNQQTRIIGGEVIGRIHIEANSKADEGKWIHASALLDKNITGKHNVAFVFYSSAGVYLETHTAAPTPATDGRARNVGFEIDQWWFE